MIHVRFEGRSFDLHEHILQIHPDLEDVEILQRVARWLDVEPERLQHHVIDRPREPDNLIIRPEAVYG